MKIGELARRTGCDVETVRYYEKAGLLPAPPRNGSGYRQYLPEHLERLQFIRHCRSLQMAIADIRVLLQFKAQPSSACTGVDDLLDQQIAVLGSRMQALRQLEQQLLDLRGRCRQPHLVEQCGILHNLAAVSEGSDCACHGGATTP
ncbi:MAG: Cd(II)/Pb(II)-responsive transcriptional regulator [Duganella sp.]